MMSPQPTPPDGAPPSATTTPILPMLPPPPDPTGWTSPLPPGELPGYPPPPYPPYPSYPPYQPPLPLYPPYPGYMPYYPGPMAPSTSYWAIASLACTLGGFALIFFLGVSFLLVLIPFVVPAGALLGVICGHVALVDISRSRGVSSVEEWRWPDSSPAT